MIRVVGLLLGVALALPPPPALAQGSPLAVRVEDGSARVAVGDILNDAGLEEALRSGLPVRLRFKVELWRDRLFDALVDQSSWTLVMVFEPLESRFLVGGATDPVPEVYPSFAAARTAVERVYTPGLRPTRPGRYYYLTALEIETLSLSDLEELGHWLRGELGPAVQGQRSVAGALGTGLRRAFMRVLRLPTRQYQARSEVFRVP